MGNQVPFSTVYFCGNCEEEVVGMPAGSRLASGRPLCLRCTQIGQEEGWAAPSNSPQIQVYETGSKRGIILVLFMIALAGLAIFMVNALGTSGTRR